MGRAIFFIGISFLFLFQTPSFAQEEEQPDQQVEAFIQELFQARAQILLDADPVPLEKFYTKEKTSVYAKGYELRRAKYIQAWAKLRDINVENANNQIRIVRVRKKTDDQASVSLIQTLRVTYRYANGNLPHHSFGIGTRHHLSLKRVQNQWYVSKEYYSDPMEENPNNIPVNGEKAFMEVNEPEQMAETGAKRPRYNREKAVAYANKYAGAAWGAGNNHRYNPNYRDYHYQGGDCTNFASQVIGDPEEGGGLPMTRTWRYYKSQGGTVAWVQTDSFKRFLINSGYGQVIGYGYFSDLAKPNSRHPNGAIAKIQPGDLIGYEMRKGDIDHFSVVVGKDANGYPLVNSHTGDRFQVPWDIGWDKYTRFIFIHIRD